MDRGFAQPPAEPNELRRGRVEATGPPARDGHPSSCLSDCASGLRQAPCQGVENRIRHGTAKSARQTAATARLLQAGVGAAEVGGTAHPPVEGDAAPRQTDQPPEQAAIPQGAAGNAAPQHHPGLGSAHRASAAASTAAADASAALSASAPVSSAPSSVPSFPPRSAVAAASEANSGCSCGWSSSSSSGRG